MELLTLELIEGVINLPYKIDQMLDLARKIADQNCKFAGTANTQRILNDDTWMKNLKRPRRDSRPAPRDEGTDNRGSSPSGTTSGNKVAPRATSQDPSTGRQSGGKTPSETRASGRGNPPSKAEQHLDNVMWRAGRDTWQHNN